MRKFRKPTESEMEIMKAIWEVNTPVTISQLLTIFKERNWKIQTIATFLTRLADKGIVLIEKGTKGNLYSAAVSEQEYNRRMAQDLLETMYNGSLRGFLSALYCNGEVESKDMDEIKKWFDEVSNSG